MIKTVIENITKLRTKSKKNIKALCPSHGRKIKGGLAKKPFITSAKIF